MTRSSTSYHGKHIYIGIDVHRKSYTLTCRCDGLVIKRCHMAADPTALVEPFTSVRTYRKASPPNDELREFSCAEGLASAK